MPNDHHFSDFINEVSIQTKMENVWGYKCGSWQNCNQETIQSFLAQCLDYNIDPHFCISWIEQHMDQIPNWTDVSKTALGWLNQHTSTSSAISFSVQDLS